ncbi:MAG: hypothetical protein A2Z04_06755 [Chloroflexi bacterium RBG_16_57_9]|nr:MAG: hypothetical protein A2Z04_06755 [Chloroflexi bacterium RBG_16_57_9]
MAQLATLIPEERNYSKFIIVTRHDNDTFGLREGIEMARFRLEADAHACAVSLQERYTDAVTIVMHQDQAADEYRHDPATGRVYWMADWSQAHRLVKEGIFTLKSYPHLYGHVDFYVVQSP